MWKFREIQDRVTNVVMNYSEVEAKVREATNDDQWGPHGSLLNEIAKHTFTYEHFPEVMGMMWKRMLLDGGKNWRRIYKCLLLLNYLLRNGSERVVTSARDHIYDMRALETFTFTDENGRDQGLNVRHKVKETLELIQDDSRLREERKRTRLNRDKYVGLSSDALEDSAYSDRYSKEPKSISSADFNDAEGDLNKSKFQGFKDKIGSFRPKKDYNTEYNERRTENEFSEYRDEPEDGEEVKEEDEVKEETEEAVEVADSSQEDILNTTNDGGQTQAPDIPKVEAVSAIDLLNSDPPPFESSEPVQDFADFSTFQSSDNPAKPASAMDELADILTAPSVTPLVPLSGSATTNAQPNIDLFGDFNAATVQQAPVLQTQQPALLQTEPDDFAQFDSLATFNTPAKTDTKDNFDFGGPIMMDNPHSNSPSVWSNTGVDISLDALSPGLSKNKPMQPTMNQMQPGLFPQQPGTLPQQQGQMSQQPGMLPQQQMQSNFMSLNMSMANMSMRPQMTQNMPMTQNIPMTQNNIAPQQMQTQAFNYQMPMGYNPQGNMMQMQRTPNMAAPYGMMGMQQPRMGGFQAGNAPHSSTDIMHASVGLMNQSWGQK